MLLSHPRRHKQTGGESITETERERTRSPRGSVSAPVIFFDPCPTGDLLGGALSAVRT